MPSESIRITYELSSNMAGAYIAALDEFSHAYENMHIDNLTLCLL